MAASVARSVGLEQANAIVESCSPQSVFILHEKSVIHHSSNIRQQQQYLRFLYPNAPSYSPYVFSAFGLVDLTRKLRMSALESFERSHRGLSKVYLRVIENCGRY